MLNFNLHTTTEVVFGKDIEEQIGPRLKELGAHRILVHFGGSSARTSGLLDRVEKSLFAAGLAFVELGGVSPNPKVSLVRKGIALAEREGIDFVLAVGGGSVIDSAKAIAMGVATKTDPWQFASTGTKPDTTLPVGTVLTLAASGSESSNSCVLTNEETKEKRGITSETNRPRISFLDPENTYTVSKFQTGCGIVDIMMHTLERYLTPEGGESDLTDRIAEGLLIAVRDAGRRAIADPRDYEARATLMWASSLACNGICVTGNSFAAWVCHGIEHELSAFYDITHGEGLAIVTPVFFRYSLNDETVGRFATLANRVFDVPFEADLYAMAEKGFQKLEAFFASIGLPSKLSQVGITSDEHFEAMAESCMKLWDFSQAIRPLDKDDVVEILKRCL